MKKVKYMMSALALTTVLLPLSTNAITKNEVIYSNMNYNGEFYKTIVNNHLILQNEEDEINDESKLKNILNINGKETYKLDGKRITWQNLGKDIFYSGEIEEDQPIKTEIKYYLDGKEYQVEELIGKKGKVKIEFKFSNALKNRVKVNDKYEELYTPFVVTMGTIIDNRDNTNIVVSNGKSVDTGSKNMIIALASPGLYESLNIEQLSSMNEITIEYDTTNFSLSNTYIVATPKLIEEVDLKVFDKLDSLYSNVTTLQVNMDKLTEGAKKLDEGASKVSTGANELSSNIKIAKESIEKIKNGSINLNEGLNTIVEKLTNASGLLNDNKTEDSIKNLEYLKEQNTKAVNSIIKESNLTYEVLSKLYNDNNLKDYTGSDEELNKVKSAYELIVLLQGNNKAIDETIKNSKEILQTINSVLNQLSDGLNKAKDGSLSLSEGLNKLNAGISKIYDGSLSLSEGANELNEGTKELSNGTDKLNREGINKINSYASEMRKQTSRVEALVSLSKEYKGYSSDNSDSTMFIYLVKSLKSNN